MLKNLTLRQLFGLLILILTGLNVLIFITLYLLDYISLDAAKIWVILIILFAVLSYLLCQFLIENYVFRKMRRLYQLIKTTPQKKENSSEPLDIDNLNEEFSKWAAEKESEIKTLTQLQSYRQNFIGNISHELKTPIFSMQGYLHTLVDGGIHDEKVNVKYLNRAIANLDRLEYIVEDLDTIGNLESEMEKITFRAFDIKELVTEVMEQLSYLANKRKISIGFNKKSSKTSLVLADRKTIRVALDNLISNSIKYGRKGGNTLVSFVDLVDHVLIEVNDDGIGIESKHLKFLFDRFYRVDTGRGRKYGGSGLGLSIVKHIIEGHNETITVNSEVDKGSTFAFTLKKA